MSKHRILSHLVELEAKVDVTLFGVYRDPNTGVYKNDDGSTAGTLAKTAIGGAALGGGGYGAYRGVQAVQSRMAGMRAGPYGAPSDFAGKSTAAQAVGAMGAMARDAKAAVVESPWAQKAASGVASATGFVQSGLSKLRKAAGKFGRGKAAAPAARQLLITAGHAVSAIHNARELAARIDDTVKEFQLTTGDHLMRHYYGPLGVAATSRPGKKGQAFKESVGEYGKKTLGHTVGGAAAGALVGLAGAGYFATRHGRGFRAKKAMFREAAQMGRIGVGVGNSAAAGAIGGAVVGAARGTHGKKARAIQEKYHA